jgi:3-hydroxyacyl-[acyl-carrier-protein] dehydratase
MSEKQMSLGPDVIQWLMPHRRPFLMVDRVIYFSTKPHPTLRALKFLSSNESFFQGHFPEVMLMPGALTFEGMGQTTNLLAMIMALRENFRGKGLNPDSVFEELQQIELGYSFSPEYRPVKHKILDDLQLREQSPKYGLVGAVNLKFLEPIYPGNQIEYEAVLTGTFEDYLHHEVLASVAGNIKAKGTMSTIITLENIK